MASVFRKTYSRKLPDDAVVTTVKGKRVAKWKDQSGKAKSGEVTTRSDGSLRVKVLSPTWTAKYRDGQGVVREVATGCRDKQAANAMLAELTRRAELVKANVIGQAEDKVAKHQDTSVASHFADYARYMDDRGLSESWRNTSARCVGAAIRDCDIHRMSDIDLDKIEAWLSTLKDRDGGRLSAANYNSYVASLRAFGGWLTGKRVSGKKVRHNGEKRCLLNPFGDLPKMDESADRRRVARAMTSDELAKLIEATQARAVFARGKFQRGPRKGQMGAKMPPERRVRLIQIGYERSLIYKTAALTGLRFNELRTLRVDNLRLGSTPHIQLDSKNEKNRQGSSVTLRSDLASDLQCWTEGRATSDLVFDMSKKFLAVFDRDLAYAGIAKHEDGLVLHLHALRHTFGTHLSLSGVHPRVAQAAMRHSNISLTMRTYTDARLLDTSAAVESIGMLRDAPQDAPD